MKSFKDMASMVREETDTSEKVEMAQSQLHFIHYACEEILEFIEDGGEVEEWYQVKIAKSFSDFEGLHSYMEGEKRRTGMVDEATGDAKFDKMMKRVTSKKEVNKQQKTDTKQQARDAFGSMFGGGNPADKLSIRKQGMKEEVELEESTSQEYAAKAKEAHAKYLHHEDQVDKELRKVGERMPNSWDAARFNTKLSSHPKYAQALKHYNHSEKFASQSIRYKNLAKKKSGVKEEVVAEGKYNPAKDTFNPETHTAVTRGGVDKVISKTQLDKHKETGWKQRHSLSAFHKNREKQGMKEEVEQIDELSKKTIGSYIKNATHDVAAKGAATRQFAIDSAKKSSEQDYDGARKSMQKSDKTFSQSWKRRNNMAKAVDRLTKEDIEQIDEKNVPTSPEKWAQAKSQAKAKFDVYPSAYANGWAAKKYKAMGGGWKSVNEDNHQAPFEGGKPVSSKKSVVPGKYGVGPSTAKHLAKTAMKKQSDKMKKPVKEETSSKLKIVKSIMKKKNQEASDTFQKDPTMSKTEVRM